MSLSEKIGRSNLLKEFLEQTIDFKVKNAEEFFFAEHVKEAVEKLKEAYKIFLASKGFIVGKYGESLIKFEEEINKIFGEFK